jgi:hypothetical protein
MRSEDNLNIIWIIYVVIRVLGSSTELLDDDIFVSLVEVRLSHDLLQYLTLVLVDDCLRDDSTSNLLKKIVHERYSSIKLSSVSTKLNGIFGVESTNMVRLAYLIKLILL